MWSPSTKAASTIPAVKRLRALGAVLFPQRSVTRLGASGAVEATNWRDSLEKKYSVPSRPVNAASTRVQRGRFSVFVTMSRG